MVISEDGVFFAVEEYFILDRVVYYFGYPHCIN